MTRKLLFSVTAQDCDWDYYKGTGNGGQKKNKTASAVRCTHRASKAVGQAQDDRSQHKNKELAFKRMCDTQKFKTWLKIEFSKKMGIEEEIQKDVEKAMQNHNLKLDIKDENGLWKEVDINTKLED